MSGTSTKSRKTAAAVRALETAIVEEPVGRWAQLLSEANLVRPYQVTASITISVPDPDRAQEIRNADSVLSLLRLKLAELLLDKSNENPESQALNVIREKLAANPGDLTSQELSTLTAAIMRRRSGVPEDLFEQVADMSQVVNERLDRALLGDQYDAVIAYLQPQNYDVRDLLLKDIKDALMPTKLLPAAPGKVESSSAISTSSGTTSNQTSSTGE
ncbi:hypothetical protein BH11ACT6_BH11ACT6_34940 [soil metagenome]